MATMSWKETLKTRLIKKFGVKKGKFLAEKYQDAFSTSYQDDCSIGDCSFKVVLSDIERMEQLTDEKFIAIDFYKTTDNLRIRLYQLNQPIPLSDILPMLENFDLRTLDEHPYKVSLKKKIHLDQ